MKFGLDVVTNGGNVLEMARRKTLGLANVKFGLDR